MSLVDTHCHLQFDKLVDNLGQVIKDAQSAGVTRLICVGTSLDDSKKAIDIAAGYQNVWATVGVHPHDGQSFFGQKKGPSRLEQLMTEPKVVALGETGLDFYKNYSSKADQEKLLRLQLEIGIPTGLPFVFHIRDAWADFWRIISDYDVRQAVVHSFSAHQKELDQILERDFFVGLNGIMTFTHDQEQLAAAKKVPLKNLLLETDAPFLTPSPDRGQVCQPKHTKLIAEFLANLRGESLEIISQATTDNARKLFNI